MWHYKHFTHSELLLCGRLCIFSIIKYTPCLSTSQNRSVLKRSRLPCCFLSSIYYRIYYSNTAFYKWCVIITQKNITNKTIVGGSVTTPMTPPADVTGYPCHCVNVVSHFTLWSSLVIRHQLKFRWNLWWRTGNFS